jgi:hypothetical protein
VRLIERLPVLALPSWRHNRTRPIDGRDVLEFLAAAATAPATLAGRSWDVAGPDLMTLMEGLEHDLLPRDDDAAGAFGVRLHRFDAAVERALRDWEQTEEVAAR